MRSYIRGWCHGPVAQNKIHAGSDVPLYLHRYGSWLVEDSHLNKEKKSEEKKISSHNVKRLANCLPGPQAGSGAPGT